jgi:hypothetical protein
MHNKKFNRASARIAGTAAMIAGALILSEPGLAADAATNADTTGGGTVQAVWQPQEINFQYFGFTTAYQCDALADKVERLLQQVGVHQSVRASGAGCAINKPSRNVSVRITLLAPVEANDQNREAIAANEKNAALLKRLGVKKADTDSFPAQWKTVTLSDGRPAMLSAGDCELIEQLRDRVLPKLHVKVVDDNVRCTPHQVSIVRPKLTVSALVPTKAPA